MKALVVTSGGLDSTTLLWDVASRGYDEVRAVTFDYGARHSKEIDCARSNCQLMGIPHDVIELEVLESLAAIAGSALVNRNVDVPHVRDVMGDPQPVTYVPNRNMIFLSVVAALAEAYGCEHLYYGAQKHDIYGYWDATPNFLSAMNAVFSLNRKKPVQLLAPYINHSKGDIIRRGIELGVDYSETWSCYNGGEKPCGTCSTCAERIKGFADNGLIDPLMEN